jgi:hypothetical protein
VSGATWTDAFGPYEARIYLVTARPALAVGFTNPASGAAVSGTTTVTLAATGGTGTGYSYQLAVDGTTVYSGTNPTWSWNTAAVASGPRTLTAGVTDSEGGTATATRTVQVVPSFTATFSYPAPGATVSGAQTVGMATTAAWGQAKTFTLSVDGTVITAPSLTGTTLWYMWDTTSVANGARTLTLAVTMNGQTVTTTLPVTVSNALPALTAAFTAPAAGATVSGIATIGLASSGARGTSTFKLAVDGTVVSTQTVTGTTASYAWSTTTVPSGSHTLTLTVTDGAGRTATATRAVTVSNTAGFTASFSYPAMAATVSGGQTVGMATTATWGQAKTFTLSVDGRVITTQTVTGTTLWYTWDTTQAANGGRILTLAVSMNGQTATATLPVTINNH